MRVTVAKPNVFNEFGQALTNGATVNVSDAYGSFLVRSLQAVDTDGVLGVLSSGSAYPVIISANKTIVTTDNQVTFSASNALTLTIPPGLSPAPSFIVQLPASGNVTLLPGSGVTLNGSASSMTRNAAGNPVRAVAVIALGNNAYGVSGT